MTFHIGDSDFDDVHQVVKVLGAVVPQESMMLIGARALHFWQTRYAPDEVLRHTQDLDLCLVTDSWDTYAELREMFHSGTNAWQSFCIAGYAVDIVPFGEIEDPPGDIHVNDAGVAMSVHGFRPAFDSAIELRWSDGTSLRCPTLEGLVLLKLEAWLDRGMDKPAKDASDIARAFSWRAEWGFLYENIPFLDFYDFEYEQDRVAAAYFGYSVAYLLGESGAQRLRNLYSDDKLQELAAVFSQNTVFSSRRKSEVDAIAQSFGLGMDTYLQHSDS